MWFLASEQALRPAEVPVRAGSYADLAICLRASGTYPMRHDACSTADNRREVGASLHARVSSAGDSARARRRGDRKAPCAIKRELDFSVTT